MNRGRVLSLMGGNIKTGIRSPVILWLLVIPFAITFLMKVVFATLFDPQPRLCIHASVESEIAMSLEQEPGVRISRAGSREELIDIVENYNADMGLEIGGSFEDSVRLGLRPGLDLFISGESLASNRILIGLLILDSIRDLEGRDSPVEVVLMTDSRDPDTPIEIRLVPAIVLFVLIIAGIFVPAFMLVDERENGTLRAVLVTPVRMSEMLVSKALLGFVMTIVMCIVTLAINGALTGNIAPLLATVVTGTLVCTSIGLIYGTIAADAKTLYTLIKSLNILLIGPVAFYFFSGLPMWIARIFPTYWFIDPLYRISLEGAGMEDIWSELLIALMICAILTAAVVPLAGRMQRKIAQ